MWSQCSTLNIRINWGSILNELTTRRTRSKSVHIGQEGLDHTPNSSKETSRKFVVGKREGCVLSDVDPGRRGRRPVLFYLNINVYPVLCICLCAVLPFLLKPYVRKIRLYIRGLLPKFRKSSYPFKGLLVIEINYSHPLTFTTFRKNFNIKNIITIRST